MSAPMFVGQEPVRLLEGHALDRLRELPDESVDCCATSPPFYGLRSYGTEPQVWGGADMCEHDFSAPIVRPAKFPGNTDPSTSGLGSERYANGMSDASVSKTLARSAVPETSSAFCSLCGAWRGELGLEPSLDLYIEHMVSVFREVRRVLRETGVLWLEIGDSYSNIGKSGGSGGCKNSTSVAGGYSRKMRHSDGDIKPKDLMGVPWTLALALRADGWYLRRDVIWSKANCMPESVRDRPTTAHSYVFLLTKNERYYYDSDALREPHKGESLLRAARGKTGGKYVDVPADYKGSVPGRDGGPGQYRRSSNPREHGALKAGNGYGTEDTSVVCSPGGRNARSVWEIPTQARSEDHFAAMPDELARRMIVSGCPVGGTVLDLFGGRGTVGCMAKRYGRRAILIEILPEYCELIRANVAAEQTPLPLGVQDVA